MSHGDQVFFGLPPSDRNMRSAACKQYLREFDNLENW
jgi:hypothetical protein